MRVTTSACARSIAAQFIRNPSGALDTGCLDADLARSRELVLTADDIMGEIRKDIPTYLSVDYRVGAHPPTS